jgi:hypothetical protein
MDINLAVKFNESNEEMSNTTAKVMNKCLIRRRI